MLKIDWWEMIKILFDVFLNPKIWAPIVIFIIVMSIFKFGLKKLEKKIDDWKYKKKYSHLGSNNCPKCDGYLVERSGKFGTFLGCSNYPKCRYTKQVK